MARSAKYYVFSPVAAVIFFLFLINPVVAGVHFHEVSFGDLEGWSDDDVADALEAFRKSCGRINRIPPKKTIGVSIKNIRAGDLQKLCLVAERIPDFGARMFFEENFVPMAVLENGDEMGWFTGYYEPILRGSRTRTDIFTHPIYARPADLTGPRPYLSRREIELGALDGKGLEIFYVDSRSELFFLHVQGSGRILMPDGGIVGVGFAARNNRPYTSIGKVLVAAGFMSSGDVNAQNIKKWIDENPDIADSILWRNESFIFFQETAGEHVSGAQGVPLTPERSLAVDTSILPMGFPIWLETEVAYENGRRDRYNRLMVAQDTGSAIVGAVRGDIFFGFGPRAEELASNTSGPGRYFILVPRVFDP